MEEITRTRQKEKRQRERGMCGIRRDWTGKIMCGEKGSEEKHWEDRVGWEVGKTYINCCVEQTSHELCFLFGLNTCRFCHSRSSVQQYWFYQLLC